MPLELYQGRPGFQHPYEGPTRPGVDDPSGCEAFGLHDRLTRSLARFEPQDAVIGPRVEDA